MPSGTPLSEYLHARRALVRPEDVGLSQGSRRRVAGLRREELAMLAGISPSYYLRLEQGRDRRPSAQVIGALARALQLDADATAFLHSLARPEPETRKRPHADRAPTSIEWLIHSWRATPAFVHDRHMNILAANRLALALTPPLRPGANAVRAMFMDPAMRQLYADGGWQQAARDSLGRLRVLVGRDVEDPALCELVRDLSETSDDFRELWARHDIDVTMPRSRFYDHPVVGRLEVFPQLLAIGGTDRQVLYIRHTEPGSPSERALHRLAHADADTDPVRGGDSGALANAGGPSETRWRPC
jgi:transcriptional regulator with XRE-family HTH domain